MSENNEFSLKSVVLCPTLVLLFRKTCGAYLTALGFIEESQAQIKSISRSTKALIVQVV